MHRALALSVFSSTFLVLTTLSGTTGDPGIQPLSTLHDDSSILQTPAQQPSFQNSKEFDDSNQIWKDFKNTLAKGGWGKNPWRDIDYIKGLKNPWLEYQARYMKPSFYDFEVSKRSGRNPSKRGWDQFNGGWGKRSGFSNDDLAEFLYDLSKYYENEKESGDEVEKRDWNNFQGSWGKRNPPLRSFNDVLGKRSGSGKWDRLNGGWG